MMAFRMAFLAFLIIGTIALCMWGARRHKRAQILEFKRRDGL